MPTGGIVGTLRGRSDALMKVAGRGCTDFLMVSSQPLSENADPNLIVKSVHSDSPPTIHGMEELIYLYMVDVAV